LMATAAGFATGRTTWAFAGLKTVKRRSSRGGRAQEQRRPALLRALRIGAAMGLREPVEETAGSSIDRLQDCKEGTSCGREDFGMGPATGGSIWSYFSSCAALGSYKTAQVTSWWGRSVSLPVHPLWELDNIRTSQVDTLSFTLQIGVEFFCNNLPRYNL
jgi:hypothetical protein